MRDCPQCYGAGFVPSPSTPVCLENIGGRQTYSGVVIRRYLCNNCGHAFYSHETPAGPITLRTRQGFEGGDQSGLFADS